MSIIGRIPNPLSKKRQRAANVMDRRYESEKDVDDLALRLDRYAEAIDPYEYEDSEYSINEARMDVNNPTRLQGVIDFLENDESMSNNLDDKEIKMIYGITKNQQTNLIQDLKKRFNDLIGRH